MKFSLSRLKIISLLLILLNFCYTGYTESLNVAIVVNKNNELSDVSLVELKKIFTKKKTRWVDGKKIFLILPTFSSEERDIVLSKIYNMNDVDLKKFWLSQLFQGGISKLPKQVNSKIAVKRFVERIPNAISFINLSDVTDDLKVLRVNGKLPSDLGYLLNNKT